MRTLIAILVLAACTTVEAIERTARYRLAQNELELLDASGDVVARFH